MNHRALLPQILRPAAGGVEQEQAVEQQHPVEQRILPDHKALEGVHGAAAKEREAQADGQKPRSPPPHPYQTVCQHGGHGGHLRKAEEIGPQFDQPQFVKGPENQPEQQRVKDGVGVVQAALQRLLQKGNGVHIQPHRAPAQKHRQPQKKNHAGVQRQLTPQRPGGRRGHFHRRQMCEKPAQPQQDGEEQRAENHPEQQKGKVKLHGAGHCVLAQGEKAERRAQGPAGKTFPSAGLLTQAAHGAHKADAPEQTEGGRGPHLTGPEQKQCTEKAAHRPGGRYQTAVTAQKGFRVGKAG